MGEAARGGAAEGAGNGRRADAAAGRRARRDAVPFTEDEREARLPTGCLELSITQSFARFERRLGRKLGVRLLLFSLSSFFQNINFKIVKTNLLRLYICTEIHL